MVLKGWLKIIEPSIKWHSVSTRKGLEENTQDPDHSLSEESESGMDGCGGLLLIYTVWNSALSTLIIYATNPLTFKIRKKWLIAKYMAHLIQKNRKQEIKI